MNNSFFRYFLWMLLFVLLQIFVFSHLPLATYAYPMIYVLFVLILPIGYSHAAVLLWAFFLGLSIDIFTYGILGMHTAATVAMAYARPFILKLVTSKEDRENTVQIITKQSLGARFFLTYTGLAIALHHTIYFLLDTFNFFDVIHTFLLIFLSTLLSVIFVFVFSSLMVSPRRNASF